MLHSVWFGRVLCLFVGVGAGVVLLWIIGTWEENARKRENIGNRMWQDSAEMHDTIRESTRSRGDSHTTVGRN